MFVFRNILLVTVLGGALLGALLSSAVINVFGDVAFVCAYLSCMAVAGLCGLALRKSWLHAS